MKQKALQGSIVLLVLIIMGVLMLLMHTGVIRKSFLNLGVAKRASQEKNMALCLSLLRYGVRIAQEHYDVIFKKGQEIAFEVPLEKKRGTVFLAPYNDGIIIRSEVWQENTCIIKCSSRLLQNSDKKFIIQGFQR